MIANWTNWAIPSHHNVARDVWMEHASSATTNRGRMTKYDDIKVHDVVRRKIPWFREVVGVVGGVYDTSILIPTLKPFSLPKKDRPEQFYVFDDGTKHPIMYLDAAKNIMLPWPPTSGKSTAGNLKPYPTIIPAPHFIHGDWCCLFSYVYQQAFERGGL